MSPSKDEGGSGTSTPKIAIKGFSLSSKPPSSKPGAKPLQSSLGKRPRSTFAAHDESDSEGEHHSRHGRHEVVTGFGAEGAIKHEEKKKAEQEEKKKAVERQASKQRFAESMSKFT